MNTVLYFSADGAAYETRAYSAADVDQLVHDHGLQCLTSSDRQFDFWFSPATRRCQRRINRRATELLLATTTLTAKTVPVLHGAVVVATHDADGDLDGLSWQQLDLLAERSGALSKRERRQLARRLASIEGKRRMADKRRPTAAPVSANQSESPWWLHATS